MKLGQKLFLIFGVVILFAVTGEYISIAQFNKVTDNTDELAYLNLMAHHAHNMTIGVNGYLIGNPEYRQEFQEHRQSFDREWQALREYKTAKNDLSTDDRSALDKIAVDQKAYVEKVQSLFDLYDEQKRLSDKVIATWTEVDYLGHERDAMLNKLIVDHNESLEFAATAVSWLLLIITVLTVLVGLTIAVLIARFITSAVVKLKDAAVAVGEGDLKTRVDIKSKDEIGILAGAFNQMVEKLEKANAGLKSEIFERTRAEESLKEQAMEIMEGVNVLAASSSEIFATTSQLAASASQIAAAINETTTTITQVRQTAQVASEKSELVSQSAQQTAQISQTGHKATNYTIAEMNRINTHMESITESILTLGEQSQAIGEIIATVDDLAYQTNLLAVNASIEAAKAGEQGKGFTVVAQEIKNLAEQSKQATAQVRTILKDIQNATGAAVMTTEQGNKAVIAGLRQSAEAGQSIKKLAEGVAEGAQSVRQISASSREQLVGVNQVVTAMENIKQASLQNFDSSKQLEFEAQNLQQLGHRLKQLVDQYSV